MTSSFGLLSPLSYTTHDHLFKGDTTYNGLGPPISIIKQEKAPPTCPDTNLVEAIPQLKVSDDASWCYID